MAKPPDTPPASDIDGVHEDRAPADDAREMDAAARKQRAQMGYDSPGTPGPLDAGEGRGGN